MDSDTKKKVKYDATIHDASEAYENGHYDKAFEMYNEALALGSELKLGKMVICVLKYMSCCCLFQSNNLDDFYKVIVILQCIDKSQKDRMPAIYCLLAKTHSRLYRFEEAECFINQAEALFNKNSTLECFYIPGTTNIIEPVKKNDVWLQIKEQCSIKYLPDAICSLTECKNITKPYITPNVNIYKGDPAFQGMVVVKCNNKNRVCTTNYHKKCWEFKKDQMYNMKRVSDQAILGNKCFTPHCKNDVPCAIAFIQTITADGEIKTQRLNSAVTLPEHESSSKGAIKKVNIKPEAEKKKVPPNMSSFNPYKTISPNKMNNDYCGYNGNQIVVVNGEYEKLEFPNDSSEVAMEKNFLFSIFYEYIKNDLVRISDLYIKFQEFVETMRLKHLDILTFLLETEKIIILDNTSAPIFENTLISSSVENVNNMLESENACATTCLSDTIQEIDDVYSNLMSDEDDNFDCNGEKPINKNDHEYKFNTFSSDKIESDYFDCNEDELLDKNKTNNFQNYDFVSNRNFSDDYQSICKTNETHNKVSSVDTYSTTNDVENVNTENRRLKQYIIKLEADLKEKIDESCYFQNELKQKSQLIESLQREQEEYIDKIKRCESLYESLEDFRNKFVLVREENIKMKKEICTLLEEKNVNNKLLEDSDLKLRKQEQIKTFQEEFKILEDCINSDWEKKTQELRDSLDIEKENKISLLNRCINYKYTGYRNLLGGHIDQCKITLQVIHNINKFMEKTLHLIHYVDGSEWTRRLTTLKQVLSNLQTEYSALLDQLNSDSSNKNDLDNNLNFPTIEKSPVNGVVEITTHALDTFYENQCRILQRVVKAMVPPQTPCVEPHVPLNTGPYHQFQPYQFMPTGFPPVSMSPMVPSIVPPMVPPLAPPLAPPLLGPAPAPASILVQPLVNKVLNGVWPVITSQCVEQKRFQNHVTDTIAVTNCTQQVFSKTNTVATVDIQIKKENCSLDEVKTNGSVATETLPIINGNKNLSENGNVSETCNINHNNTNEKDPESNLVYSENKSDKLLDNLTVSTKSDTQYSKQRIGIDKLLSMMSKKYPEALEADIIEIIFDIRKNHNNSLSGVSLAQIFKESEKYLLQARSLNMLHYLLNDENRSTCSESSSKASLGSKKKSAQKKVVSTPVSLTSLSKVNTTSVISASSPRKNAWNIVTKEEVNIKPLTDDMECSICMYLVSKKNCYILSCQHAFHTLCIKEWLKYDRSCPNCRILITEDSEFPALQ